jgi:hypothetical protein
MKASGGKGRKKKERKRKGETNSAFGKDFVTIDSRLDTLGSMEGCGLPFWDTAFACMSVCTLGCLGGLFTLELTGWN